MLVRDIIDNVNLNNSEGALLSLDQEKAFDKVDWSFLIKVLRKLGLSDNFIKWITILYKNINSKLFINGRFSQNVEISRGVRQGCPLSPLLYVLFIEPIARYIHYDNSIVGFVVPGSKGKRVKLLQYADDATCVASSVSDVLQFIHVFDLFKWATGASLNINKTCGLKLGSLASKSIPSNISWSESSIKITGVIFGSHDAIERNWVEKIKLATKRLNLWKNRYLSLIGKVTVINTLIYPIFFFVAPIFPIPESFIKDLNKVIFPFIWGENKPDLVPRKVLILPKEEGGLGLDNFSDKMVVLFVKTLFPLFDKDICLPLYLTVTRFFVAKSLRGYVPFIWSNSRPNSDYCPDHLSFACQVLEHLFVVNNSFNTFSRTRDIVKLLKSPNVNIATVMRNPLFPWPRIWNLAFTNFLDNKLKDFQWRLSHGVLYVGSRIKKMGHGKWFVSNE